LIQECIDLKISDTVMTSQERNKFRARRSKRTQSLKHSFKKVSVSHAQLAHFSTLAKENANAMGYKDGLQPETPADGKGLQGVTRMAYSPRLWLMAIGW